MPFARGLERCGFAGVGLQVWGCRCGFVVSGRQLQQQEPGAETGENDSVTEGPGGEIIRPRPQGSSPVYEYTPEGAGLGAQENSQGRRSSSGRRRSWWKRDSGESTGFSSMSHSEEATEVTLKTEAESGASGYSVTGGGDQGLFVKQVLKDSSAAKLFSLREGDQLLSATIFFDHMKYEDALKILQYSEPYKVQFRIKRKLSASKGEESAVHHSQQGLKGQENQDIADGYMETPTKTLESDGDRERLISKSRDGRQRRPQDRLSWPKFQALRSKRGPGPRRSHSSSEASEHRGTRDVSPTSTDTEAQLTADSQEQTSTTARGRRRFLNLRFGMGSGQGENTAKQTHRETQDRQDHAGEQHETQPQEHETQETGVMTTLTAQMPKEHSHSSLNKEDVGEVEVKSQRQQRKKKHEAKEAKEKTVCEPRGEPGPGRSWDDEWEEVQSLEIGIARLSLQDKPEHGSTQFSLCDTLSTEHGFSRKMTEGEMEETRWRESGYRKKIDMQVTDQTKEETRHSTGKGGGREDIGRDTEHKEGGDSEEVTDMGLIRVRMPKFRMPSFGWSPTKEAITTQKERKDLEKKDNEKLKEEMETYKMKDIKERETTGKKQNTLGQESRETKERTRDKSEATKKEMNFKMPKFKMPTFGVSMHGEPNEEASLEVAAPKLEAEVTLPSMQDDIKTTDLSIKLPIDNMEVKADHVGVKLSQLPEGELPAQAAAGADLKSHILKVHMPDLNMPKVDLKGPHVELKVAKVDVKGPKGEVSGPEVD
ncbi:protein AHNAK2-like protein, partial [Cricetulus griseus]